MFFGIRVVWRKRCIVTEPAGNTFFESEQLEASIRHAEASHARRNAYQQINSALKRETRKQVWLNDIAIVIEFIGWYILLNNSKSTIHLQTIFISFKFDGNIGANEVNVSSTKGKVTFSL